jgi:hypothetical protein
MAMIQSDDVVELLILQSIQQRKQLISKAFVSIAAAISKWRKIRKWRQKLKERRRRIYRAARAMPIPRHSLEVFQRGKDIYEATGLFLEEFLEIFNGIRASLMISRARTANYVPTALHPMARLVLVLDFLRHGGKYRRLAEKFHISTGTVSRELRFLIPKVYVYLHEHMPIEWPRKWVRHAFENISAAVDCTAHFRHRVHPGQALYYRGDKHAHFLNAIVVVSLQGEFYYVEFVPGHNNDQGTFNMTDARRILEEQNQVWAADNGFHHHRLRVPTDSPAFRNWNSTLCGLRSVVEISIGQVKAWAFAAEVCALQPELQAVALMIIYMLANNNIKRFPRRLSLSRYQS